MREAINNHLKLLGVQIENRRSPPKPGQQVESTAALASIFDADAGRQKLEHDLALRGGSFIPSNADSLGRIKEPAAPVRSSTDGCDDLYRLNRGEQQGQNTQFGRPKR
jgi:hypothetical protein